MKHSYSKFFIGFVFVMMLLLDRYTAVAQCPPGYPPGSTAYDTTIATPPGINTLQIKFPQFDPAAGMVTCVRLCISITGVVDSVSVENNSTSPQTADIYYIRTDQITGPGLSGALTNSINFHYGPYALGAADFSPGSGLDFVAISHDTLLNSVQVCGNISDSAALSVFYGHDSVTYNYSITAFTNISCTGGNYNSTVATSALVRIHFEYCTCPGYVLPLNIRDFNLTKIADNKAGLNWSTYDNNTENYRYEVQVSRDGSNFSTLGRFAKNAVGHNIYNFEYTNGQTAGGTFFFRIKQVYSNGVTYYSVVKQVTLEGSKLPKFIIYPNPSDGIIGIKFDNNDNGKMLIQVFNSQGQKVIQKEIVASGSSYQQIAALQSGVYWLKLTDVTSQLSSVNQLFIK